MELRPDWSRLGLAPGLVTAANTETGEPIPFRTGEPERGLAVDVARHDVALVLLAPPGGHTIATAPLGTDLPRPDRVIEELSESFAGPDLPSTWTRDLHEGNSGVYLLDGRLCIQGANYGFTHVRRQLGIDNVTVQCLIMRPPTGTSDTAGASLFLYWENGAYLQATPGVNREKFMYTASGRGRWYGSSINAESPPGWFPFMANWVRIALTPDGIVFSGSADGTTWREDRRIDRRAAFTGAPAWVMLGNGQPGEQPYLNNVVAQHFHPSGTRAHPAMFFGDLVVGRE